jgi:hypothetical protein
MANSYQWLTLSAAISQLGQRLNITPSSSSFWTTTELETYIVRSLQMFNSLCWQWRVDFQYNDRVNLWNSLGNLAGSPRQRTILDTDVYAELEFMLLEPSTNNGVWTGTNQFSIQVLSQALQRRRDEMIQVGNLNQTLMSGIPVTPNVIRTYLPNSTSLPDVIDIERIRYLPAIASPTGSAAAGTQTVNVSYTSGIVKGQTVLGTGISTGSVVIGIGSGTVTVSIPTSGIVSGPLTFTVPNTLYRDDTVAQEWYESPLYQQNPGTPTTFSLSSEPPLSFDVDIPPAQPGTYEAIVLQSGMPFNPPASTLIGIPNDFTWVLEFGALADLLGQESESTDRERSAYCLKRYQDGLQLMLKTPWIELGKVNGQAVSLDSIVALDRYEPEWDSNPTGFGPVIVVGGMDFIGAPVGQGIGCTLLGNSPILDPTGTYVQVSRSDWEIVIILAQVRACFKMGGQDFTAALELEKTAIQACAAENSRLRSMGAFSDVLDQRGLQQERDANRYNSKQK